MSIVRNDSQQTTCSATVETGGERRQAAIATCTIRPGRSMTFSIDMVEGVYLSEEDKASIAQMFMNYLVEALGKARELGILIE